MCLINGRHTVSYDHGQLIERPFPLRNRGGPVFGDALQAQIEHFEDRFIRGKRPALFSRVPSRIIQGLADSTGRRSNVTSREKACAQQPARVEPLQPLGVIDITLSTGDSLRVVRIR